MSLSKYTSTTETTNLARVARIILGPCTDVLRDILGREIPPSTLSKTVRTWIDHLKNQKAKNPLSKQQTDLIFPPFTKQYCGNYSDFDVTILYLLLRNVCNVKEHAAGWGNQPNPGDRSVSANIERIRLIRNKYYGHTSDFSLKESDFRQEWRNIRYIIVELEGYLGTNTSLQDSVDEIKTCSMDPELEKKYIDKLLVIDELQKTVENLSDDIKRLHCVIPAHVKAQHEAEYISKWKEEDSVFVETHGFPGMLQRVRDLHYVTFVGVPGSGKSATAQHIALILQTEGYEVVPVLDFRDLTQYCDPQNPQVFVINDVVGVLGVNKAKLESFLEYEQQLIKPSFEKTKVLLTCRETLFNQCYKSLFTNEQNVIKLHSSENELNEDDQRNILDTHGLDRDLLSSAMLTESSRMFPLLCKLYSREGKFRINGERFFISPIQCIVEEFDKMQQRNSLFYATLVLCTLNNNTLSEDILKDDKNKCFGEMKRKVLERCEVTSSTDTFKLMKALSAMEGTYTKRRGREFTFVHDSMFEITAYHFGRQFPELIIEYMRSSYIANCVKLRTYGTQNEMEMKEKSPNERNDCLGSPGTSTDKNMEVIEAKDLCIKVSMSLYHMLAERLYRDIENMELYDVFMNKALKDNELCKSFIDVLDTKSYTELKSLFLFKQENISNVLERKDSSFGESENDKKEKEIEDCIEDLLLDTRRYILEPSICCVRVISWVLYYGHHQILRYIVNQTELHKETSAALFGDLNSDLRNLRLTLEQGKTSSCYLSKALDDFDDILISDSLKDCFVSSYEKENIQNSAVEQTRLLVLSCYGGDVETVKILLRHVNLSYAINRTQHIFSHRAVRSLGDSFSKNTPLVAACLFGHVAVAKELIGLGADVNKQGQSHTPLTAACSGGHLSVVRELCKMGANVNLESEYQTPLIEACRRGCLGIVNELLNFGALINLESTINFHFPLIAACENGHLDVVKRLLQSGAVINQKTDSNTPLISACLSGELIVVRELLKAGAIIDLECGNNTANALTAACNNGHVLIVKELLKAGAKVNPQGLNNTPLNVACRGSHFDVVVELLKAGADVNASSFTRRPLIDACLGRPTNFQLIKKLLEAKANVNQQGEYGYTPLLISIVVKNDKSLIKYLIEAGADINQHNKECYTPLAAACAAGNLNLVKDFLEMGGLINPQQLWYDSKQFQLFCFSASFQGMHLTRETILEFQTNGLGFNHITPLTAACFGGNLSVVREILQNGADVNPKYVWITPLIASCKCRNNDVLKELLKFGANVNFNPWYPQKPVQYKTPLTAACKRGNLDIVKELLNANAVVNPLGESISPLVAACANGYVEVVKELLKKGADVKLQSKNSTPLTAACKGGHFKVVKELLEAGAKVNLNHDNNKDHMPLILSCQYGRINIVKELIRAGADVNFKGKHSTPLTAACLGEYVDIVRELLDAGAKVNQSTLMDTPLIAACRGRNATTVKMVLEAGASVNLQNQNGETPLYKIVGDNTFENPLIYVLKVLVERGADCTICTRGGMSPLYIALIQNKMNVFKFLKKSENKQQQITINRHLFTILKDLRHADVATDSKDDVVFTKKLVWDLQSKSIRANSDVLKHLLCIGLDPNQEIFIRKEPNQSDIKPLLFRIIDGKLSYVKECHEKMVDILLEAGADVNLRVKYTEYKSLVDKEGVSALERTMKLICEYKHDPKRNFATVYKREMVRRYRTILKDIKNYVRRYSV